MEITRPPQNFFMRNATLIAVGVVSLLTLASVLLFTWQSAKNDEARQWLIHTYEVRGHIRQLTNNIKAASVSHLDFILTGQDESLDNYNAAWRNYPSATTDYEAADIDRSIDQEVAMLRHMTIDNPTQQNRIDALEQAVADIKKHFADTIETRRSIHMEAPPSELKLDRHRQLLQRIEDITNRMRDEETHLISLRTETEELATNQFHEVIMAVTAIFYLLIIFVVWFYQRIRRRAEKQLQDYAKQLERSEEELKMQQEELRASNEEIEASNEELEEKSRALEEKNNQLRLATADLNRSKLIIEEKINEVEQASRYKSEFLANMSHELRTPLNSLLILSKLLAQNQDKNLTAEQVEDAWIIYNGGMELLNLINDILDLSKVEAGKISVILDDAPINDLVTRMHQQFDPVANQRKLAFQIDLANDLPLTIHTDIKRVDQILKNLLSNALKFTEKGSVKLVIRKADSNLEQSFSGMSLENAITLSVIDTGVGIDKSKFKDIFEAFQQEDGSIDRHYGGTGLGLTIARKFAHLLGGEIHVASEKGEGSTFTLLLPVHLAAPRTESARLKLSPSTAGTALPQHSVVVDDRDDISKDDRVILIVEDDPVFIKILMNITKSRGYKCLCASNGESGLLLAANSHVNGIILDLNLPDMDGMKVMAQLRSNVRTRHIPIHVISGRENSHQLSLQQGALGHLSKPAEKEQIEAALAKLEAAIKAGVKRVLVIESDLQTQEEIKELLEKNNIEISIAKSGSEGMAQLAASAFDCIILDFSLSDSSALVWLQRMTTTLQRALPPVIIYTQHELSEQENSQLAEYTSSIIIKGSKSSARLLDDISLFLHSVHSALPSEQQKSVRMKHDNVTALQGHTLLLVDDDLRNTFALSKVLKQEGLNIVIAENGQIALDKLKENKDIELVIMDIMMPIMDGYQAMRAIRADENLKSLPIISLTARAMPDEIEKCVQAGANDYMTKPVDIDRLLALLRIWLARQE